MTTFMNNLNEKLFTELTPTESAVIQGGAEEYRGGVTQNTGIFEVDPGSDLKLSTFTQASNNSGFFAELQNLDNGNKFKKWVSIGNDTTFWTDLAGGNTKYQMVFRDGQDNISGTRGANSVVLSSGNY